MTTRKLVAVAISVLFVLGLPIALYVSQEIQDQRAKAAKETMLYFKPETTGVKPLKKKTGETAAFDIYVEPGSSLPSFIKLEILFNPQVLSAIDKTSFKVNTQSFPATVEGPLFTQNSILVAVSIGKDSAKAIKEPTKIATVSFKVISGTGTVPTSVSFGDKSQILSVASGDEANKNVLSTTSPAFVAATSIPTCVDQIDNDQNGFIDAADSTCHLDGDPALNYDPDLFEGPIPSPTLKPLPTQEPSATTLSLTVFMHGIGNSGDNANPTESSFSNKNPKNTTRSIAVSVFNASNNLTSTGDGELEYKNDTGNFIGMVNMGTTIPISGTFTIKVQSPTHLRKQIPGIQTITTGLTNTIPPVHLTTGDADNNNVLNVLDLNLLLSCYSDMKPAKSCNSSTKMNTDFNDDGNVNQFDYNLYLRELSVQSGD